MRKDTRYPNVPWRDDSERSRFFSVLIGKTLLVFFTPFVIIGNMWVFYALYRGMGLGITAVITALLITLVVLYVDRAMGAPASKRTPRFVLTTAALSLVISGLIALWV